MAIELYHMFGCCGFREIHGILNGKIEENLVQLLCGYLKGYSAYFTESSFRFHKLDKSPSTLYNILFTQAVPTKNKSIGSYGDDFAEYIRKHNLGLVVKGATSRNPNYSSGHWVTGYIWTPNPKGLWKWWLKHKPAGVTERPANPWATYAVAARHAENLTAGFP